MLKSTRHPKSSKRVASYTPTHGAPLDVGSARYLFFRRDWARLSAGSCRLFVAKKMFGVHAGHSGDRQQDK